MLKNCKYLYLRLVCYAVIIATFSSSIGYNTAASEANSFGNVLFNISDGATKTINILKKIAENIAYKEEVLLSADKLSRGYYYDEAIEILRASPDYALEISDDQPIRSKINEIERAKADLIKYAGPIHHIFFHSLIIYPELTFGKKGNVAQSFNMWMTTVSEFKKILPLLKEAGYILYNLTDLIESDDLKPEKVKLKDIMLPPNRIPLVISIDDVSYYEYMENCGFASRLVLSDDGRVYTQIVTLDGETELTRDGDVMPILDDYVDENPDFSWRGAKGTIALTGYQGAFGYRIMSANTKEENETATALARTVADALKSSGWLFACHSYGHSQFFRDGSITLNKLKKDSEKWKKTIEPVVGKTNIYISPFGISIIFKPKSAYSKYLVENGFNIFCNVGERKEIYFHGNYIIMPRLNIDGFKMMKGKSSIRKYYFDPDQVLDPARPQLENPSKKSKSKT